MELTKEGFDAIPDGEVILKGEIPDSPLGINMTNSGRMLKWVAKKGYADDWGIYCHWSESGYEFVISNGDKVTSERNIKRLMPCTEEVFKKYRY